MQIEGLEEVKSEGEVLELHGRVKQIEKQAVFIRNIQRIKGSGVLRPELEAIAKRVLHQIEGALNKPDNELNEELRYEENTLKRKMNQEIMMNGEYDPVVIEPMLRYAKWLKQHERFESQAKIKE